MAYTVTHMVMWKEYTTVMGLQPLMRYRPADEQICETLRDGRNLATNIADDTGLSRQYVSDRLGELAEAGHVKNIGNGLYELADEPDWTEVLGEQ